MPVGFAFGISQGSVHGSVPPSVSLVNGGARWWRACNVWPGGTVGLRVGVAGQVEFVPLVVELATVDMIGMCPWALPLSHRVQLVRFQPACFLSVARPSISQGSAMVWFHLSVSGPVRSGNERVAEGTGWLPCWSCRLAPGWICSSLSNVSPPWTWISMCPFGSVPASVVGLVAVNHGFIGRRVRGPRSGTAPFCNLWWG